MVQEIKAGGTEEHAARCVATPTSEHDELGVVGIQEERIAGFVGFADQRGVHTRMNFTPPSDEPPFGSAPVRSPEPTRMERVIEHTVNYAKFGEIPASPEVLKGYPVAWFW